ncbi:MAG: carbon-nitrogen hydrolase family protein [Dehalococcoidia bacterium]|nr:carbon-nitrogen hydrolase family protein [Dehalococcoidia bacterium]
MKLALVQMTSEKAAVADNVMRMETFLNRAAELSADIICFPEMNITGYVAPRKFPDVVIGWDDPRLDPLYAWSEGSPASIVVGIVERNSDGMPFVSQSVIRGGKVVGSYRKINIASDEAMMFSPGSKVLVNEHCGVKFGVLTCADQDREGLFALCAQNGACLVLLPSAPGLFGAQARRNWRSGYQWWRETCRNGIGNYAKRLGIWTASTSQAGRTIDEDFPGGGYIFDDHGCMVAETENWSEGMIVGEVRI